LSWWRASLPPWATAPAARQKKILNFAAGNQNMDPHATILGQGQAIVRFIYRGLTRFAIKDGKVTTAEVEPDLAESWTTSEDGTVWTFKLRKGVQFHHGFGEFTAEDVKFSFERQINRTKGMLFANNLAPIKEITVIDPHCAITLKAYDPVFPLRMVGYQQGYIVSKRRRRSTVSV
jgi:peptide/nickel transport system substrate-binding protein